MPGVSTEQTGRFRRALFPLHGDQFAWRIASVAVSLVSVALILVTLGYKLRGGEPPSVLLLALLTAFAIVVLLLSSSSTLPTMSRPRPQALSTRPSANFRQSSKMHSMRFSSWMTRQSAGKQIPQRKDFSRCSVRH